LLVRPLDKKGPDVRTAYQVKATNFLNRGAGPRMSRQISKRWLTRVFRWEFNFVASSIFRCAPGEISFRSTICEKPHRRNVAVTEPDYYFPMGRWTGNSSGGCAFCLARAGACAIDVGHAGAVVSEVGGPADDLRNEESSSRNQGRAYGTKSTSRTDEYAEVRRPGPLAQISKGRPAHDNGVGEKADEFRTGLLVGHGSARTFPPQEHGEVRRALFRGRPFGRCLVWAANLGVARHGLVRGKGPCSGQPKGRKRPWKRFRDALVGQGLGRDVRGRKVLLSRSADRARDEAGAGPTARGSRRVRPDLRGEASCRDRKLA